MSLLLRARPHIAVITTAAPPPAEEPAATLAGLLSGLYTANLAQMDGSGIGQPHYESAHQDYRGCMLSYGASGGHYSDTDNGVHRFTPTSATTGFESKPVAWEQYTNDTAHIPKIPPSPGDYGSPVTPDAGYNQNCSTYDNKITMYFAATDSLYWNGGGIVDLQANAYVRGTRHPQVQDERTYIADLDLWPVSIYNPTYAQCVEKNWVLLCGCSHGTGIAFTEPAFRLRIFRPTTNPVQPWRETVYPIPTNEIILTTLARNGGVCTADKFYVCGGLNPYNLIDNITASSSGGVISHPKHGYKYGQEVIHSAPPSPLIAYKVYYVRDVIEDVGYALSETKVDGVVGPAITGIPDSVYWGGCNSSRCYQFDLSSDDPADRPPITQVSSRFANQEYATEPAMCYDELRNVSYVVGKTVTVWDHNNPDDETAWSTMDIEDWPAGGYHYTQCFHSSEFDTIYFRGSPNYADGSTPPDGVGFPYWLQWNSVALKNSPNDTRFRCNAGDLSNYIFVDGNLHIAWPHLYGDWIGTDGVPQATDHPYATLTTTTAAGIVEFTADLTPMLDTLFAENTGIYFKQLTGTSAVTWELTGNLDHGPELWITKTSGAGGGTVQIPLLWDVDMGGGNYLTYTRIATAFKFDLEGSGLTRADCQSAQWRMLRFQGFEVSQWAFFKLNPPYIEDIPSAVGSEDSGVAAAEDISWQHDIAPLGSAGDAALAAGFTSSNSNDQVINFDNPASQYHPDGKGSIGIDLWTGSNYGASIRKFLVSDSSDEWLDGPTPGLADGYMAFSMVIGRDAGDIEPVKMPGLAATYEYSGPTYPLRSTGFSARTEHGYGSTQNPEHLSYYFYLYQANGLDPTFEYMNLVNNFALRKGRWYDVQIRAKRNSFTGSTPNADGILELWLNWVKVYSKNTLIMMNDPRTPIEYFFLQVYHGGLPVATHNAKYKFGNFKYSRAFIGREHFKYARPAAP